MLRIAGGGVEARIDPRGAELTSLRAPGGPELIWQGAPGRWPDHAPILFPIIAQVPGGRVEVAGRAYPMPAHGFAATSRFEVARHGPDEALLRLADDAATRAIWPFAFALSAHWRAEAGALHLTLGVENRGDATMPFDIGIHPGFNWPIEPGAAKADHRVVFEADELAPIRRGADDPIMLTPEPHPSPVAGRVLAPTDAMFESNAMVWDRLASRALTFGRPGGAGVRLAFPGSPHLGMWMQPGAGFLCIEPWHGMPAPTGFAGDLATKPGIAEVTPGGWRDFRFSFEPLARMAAPGGT